MNKFNRNKTTKNENEKKRFFSGHRKIIFDRATMTIKTEDIVEDPCLDSPAISRISNSRRVQSGLNKVTKQSFFLKKHKKNAMSLIGPNQSLNSTGFGFKDTTAENPLYLTSWR